MTQIEMINNLIDKVEGGYVNNPNDKGGATRYGITEKTARKWGYEGDMREFPRDLAVQIYQEDYMNKINATEVEEASSNWVIHEMFDTAVNMGPGRAVRFLQRALSLVCEGKTRKALVIDGLIGSKTLEALRQFVARRGTTMASKVLVKMMDCMQGDHYMQFVDKCPEQAEFLVGWFNMRINNVQI